MDYRKYDENKLWLSTLITIEDAWNFEQELARLKKLNKSEEYTYEQPVKCESSFVIAFYVKGNS